MVHLRARLAAFIRNARGDLPQRAFARKMGVAQSTIMRIENEDQNVTLKTLEQLCKAFNVDVVDLFPPRHGTRVYPAASRDAVVASTTMVHDSAARSSTAGKSVAKKNRPPKSGKM